MGDPGSALDPPLLIVDNLADSGDFIMNESKCIYNRHSKIHIHTPFTPVFLIISSNAHRPPYCDSNYLQKQKR